MFALALYAGLTMVTNVPFYSFKDVQMKRSVPFVVIVLIALGIAVINIHPAGRAVWLVRGLRLQRLRGLWLAQGQGRSDQCHQHVD